MAKKQITRIPTLNTSLETALGIPDDIKTILEMENITRKGLARSLGITRGGLYKWEKGICAPTVPLIAFTITSWADNLRKSNTRSNVQSLS